MDQASADCPNQKQLRQNSRWIYELSIVYSVCFEEESEIAEYATDSYWITWGDLVGIRGYRSG